MPFLHLTAQALFQGANGTPDVVLLMVRNDKEGGRRRVRTLKGRVWSLVCRLRQHYVLGIRVEERHEGGEGDELMLKQLKTSNIIPLQVE
jgi:hypothetical protein